LIQNHYVRLRRSGDRLVAASLGDAKTAHLLGRVVPRVHGDWGGWLGRLQRSTAAPRERSPSRAR
jgi:hypothetical protein